MRSPSPLPARVWMLGFVSLFMDVSSEMIHSLLPLLIVVQLGASMFVLGVIEGVAEATALLLKTLSGVTSDYIRRRKGLALLGYAMGAATKPLFAIASSSGMVLLARVIDRAGKGIRGTPRDALVADSVPAHLRGAAFGLRQSLDTVGAFVGPLLAMGLLALGHDLRTIFWFAGIPGALAVLVLWLGVDEPPHAPGAVRENPLRMHNVRRLGRPYFSVVGAYALLSLARIGEAFLVLRAAQTGVGTALLPLVLVVMNVVYAASAYPVGKLADRIGPVPLLALGLITLIGAQVLLGSSERWPLVLCGVGLFGAHMGMTQGVFAAMVANTAPPDLRGTAFGLFNLGGGLALLCGSMLAGALWDRWGAPATFYTGSALAALALVVTMAPATTPPR